MNYALRISRSHLLFLLAVCVVLTSAIGLSPKASHAATSTYTFTMPGGAFGSRTFNQVFRTTGAHDVSPPYNQIRYRAVSTTGGYKVKAVNCYGGELPWSTGYQHVTAAGQLVTLSFYVPINTCFKLNFLGDAPIKSTTTTFRISY